MLGGPQPFATPVNAEPPAMLSVVALKRVMPVEQRGQVIAVELGPTGSNREEPEQFSGRRQPSRGDMSRMMREYHVRICERLG